MNIEKLLDAVADMILGVVPWFLSMFGHRDDVKAVQEKVVEMCGFLPTATSVAAMLGAANPVVTGVIGIATAICQTVSSRRAQLTLVSTRGGYGEVNGVPIEGDFIKRT